MGAVPELATLSLLAPGRLALLRRKHRGNGGLTEPWRVGGGHVIAHHLTRLKLFLVGVKGMA